MIRVSSRHFGFPEIQHALLGLRQLALQRMMSQKRLAQDFRHPSEPRSHVRWNTLKKRDKKKTQQKRKGQLKDTAVIKFPAGTSNVH